MAWKVRTTNVKVTDQYGQQHVVIKMTEIVETRFDNGSIGAKPGASKYALNGRQLQELDDGRLAYPDGSLTFKRL